MTVMTMNNVLRGLAVASLLSLAACKTVPERQPETTGATAAQTRQQPAAEVSSAPMVAFYLAQTEAAQGLAQVQINQQTSLYVAPRPVLTQADLSQVVPMQNQEGQVFLRFDFNSQGAVSLAQLTRQYVGKYLLLSVRGKLVSIPQITGPYENGKLPVRVNSVEDAQAIVQLLRQPEN